MEKSEKEWMAESDMRTLAEAEQIKSDKQRMTRAKRAGQRLLKEKKKELTALQKVSKKSPSKKSTSKKSTGRKTSKRK